MTEISKQVEAGQAVYTKLTLAIYDLWVLGISNRLIWKCPSFHLLELYNQHISGNHLDLGVGTGFFLDRCTFPTSNPRLFLMDLNPNSLEVTSRRVARYHPKTYLGLVHNCFVSAANLADVKAVSTLLEPLLTDLSRVKKVLADQGYQGTIKDVINQVYGCVIEITKKLGEGFVVNPWRWVVERTFSWLEKLKG